MDLKSPPLSTQEGAALLWHLRPLQHILDLPNVIEVCVNREKEVFYELFGLGWRREDIAEFTHETISAISTAIANYNGGKTYNHTNPLLSGTLPHGERIQMAMQPAIERESCAIAIRKPSTKNLTFDELALSGTFDAVSSKSYDDKATDKELLKLKEENRLEEFFKLAVLSHKNIIASGTTGSGKTTFLKAIAQFIPASERLITIEDAREMLLPNHPNRLHLLYNKDGQGLTKTTPKDLLEASLRFRPDRVIPAEIRGEEALYFFRSAAAHRGSMTSAHASSPAMFFEQAALMVKESDAGKNLSYSDIKLLLDLVIDVIVQFKRVNGKIFCSEIYFEPKL